MLNVGTCRVRRAPLPLQAPRLGLGLEEPRTLLQGPAGLLGPMGGGGSPDAGGSQHTWGHGVSWDPRGLWLAPHTHLGGAGLLCRPMS